MITRLSYAIALAFTATATAAGCADNATSTVSRSVVCIPSGLVDGETDECTPEPEPTAIAGSVTVSVPLFGARNDSVFPARFVTTNTLGQGVSVPLPSIPVGATIVEVSARAQDSTIGPTRLFLAISDQHDNFIVGAGNGPSSVSTGSGAFQTLTLPSISVPIQSLHTYYAGVFVATGLAPCRVSAIDVTYLPPP